MRYRVLVRLKPGVLDVQGKAVQLGIEALGVNTIADVRVGKLIELNVEAQSPEAGKKQVEQLCEQVLTNPIMEKYEIEVVK